SSSTLVFTTTPPSTISTLSLHDALPISFAIVGSEDVVEVNGRRVRARQYPWGIVEVDNPRHSDFLAVRSALLHSHLADLKEITQDRKSTRLNSSHSQISYAVFCLKKKTK